MHQLSFDFNNPFFQLGKWKIAFQVVTFENLYGLDPKASTYEKDGDKYKISARRLMWAGDQEKTEGKVVVEAISRFEELELHMEAEHIKKIRCTKIILTNLPKGKIITAWNGEQTIPSQGYLFQYPKGWGLTTPVVFLKVSADEFYYFRSLDNRVRAKRIAVYPSIYPDKEGINKEGITIELIHEDLAPEMSHITKVPPWIIGRTSDPDKIMKKHMIHLEKTFKLKSWEEREDVPKWAKEIALIAYIHGQHWTGYIFNNYKEMLEILKWLAERLEGNHILAHITGWEGRYYWQYGDYHPSPRMGGEESFKQLINGAKKLGVKLQLMFGTNCVNTGFKNFEQWGKNARLRTAGGFIYQGNKPDWDTSRSHDHGWQAWLNPGSPTWRKRLKHQISKMIRKYGINSVFLDTQQVWANDPSHPIYEGLIQLRDELKSFHPDLLIAGEGWYDALGVVTPLVQPGVPKFWPELLGRYCRCFAHNSWGDPVRGSTGVYEVGYQKFSMVPNKRYWIPTAIFVDDTLKKAPSKLEQIVNQAKQYRKNFLAD